MDFGLSYLKNSPMSITRRRLGQYRQVQGIAPSKPLQRTIGSSVSALNMRIWRIWVVVKLNSESDEASFFSPFPPLPPTFVFSDPHLAIMTHFAVIVAAFLGIQIVVIFVKAMILLPSAVATLVHYLLDIAPLSYFYFILFISLIVYCRFYIHEAITHIFKYRWDHMESVQWDHTAWDYPVHPNDPQSDRIIVCPLYMTLDRYPSSCWVRYHPTEGLKLFEPPVSSVRRWYIAQGRYTESRRTRPYLHEGSFERTTQAQPGVSQSQRTRAPTAGQQPREQVRAQPRQPAYASRYVHVTPSFVSSGIRNPPSTRYRTTNPSYQPPLIPFHHRALHRRAQEIIANLALQVANPVSNRASDTRFETSNIAAVCTLPQLQSTPCAQQTVVEPFYIHYWSELKTRLALGEPLTRLQMDWLRAPSPRLPFPTSLDEIRSQKQQPTVVDQLPVTPTLSYSTSSLNSSPTSTYVEEVSPVKVTPALHTQFNQFEPYAYIQKSVFYSSIENHTIEHQDVEMEPVEQVSSFATSSDMILDSHKMTETNTQWMPPRPASRMQVETQYSENVQSPSFSNDIDIETSAFAPSHQPAPVLGFNVPLAHPDRPVKPLKMRLYNHLRVPFNNPNPPPWTIPSMPMFPSQAFSQPAPVPPSVDMNIEAPHIALPNNFNFNPQVANPVLPPTNVAGPTSVTHPDRPVKAFRRRFLHRRQLHQ